MISSPTSRQSEGQALLDVCVRKHYTARGDRSFQLETEFQASTGITILLGPSGAGKSTLLRCIAGLSRPEQGRIAIGPTVLFDSERKINLDAARRNIAFVFQDLALFPHLTVEENVGYGLRRLGTREREQRVGNILKSFQIPELSKRYPRQISGGEQQRVALARSLVMEPSALLLDEPLSSLDVRTKAAIIDDLRGWNEARQIPVLYVTHNYEEMFALGEQVISLEEGRIIAQGAPLDVVSAPRYEALAGPGDFENLFDATVVGIQSRERTMTCRLARTSIEMEVPLARVALGETIQVGIRASEVLFSSGKPEMMSSCNLIPGRIKSANAQDSGVEARIDCGAEFRVHLGPGSIESSTLAGVNQAWMIIRPQSCHVIRKKTKRTAWQRLFVFVCTHNISRSPMAHFICNAEIAKRLGVPMESLAELGIQAISAGLEPTPGTPMAAEAEAALREMGLPALQHRSRRLDIAVVRQAEAIYCMTEDQQREATAMFPEAASKIHRLHSLKDIENPTGGGPEVFRNLVSLLQDAISERLGNLGNLRPAESS